MLNSAILAVIGGFSLAFLTSATHNLLHQRDSWRMFCFNLSGLNHREWRIGHVMSHHMFTNTHLDYEVRAFEPLVQLLPIVDKTRMRKIVAMALTPIIWTFFIKISICQR